MKIEELIKIGTTILKENKIENPIQISRIILSSLMLKPKEYLIIQSAEQISKKIEQNYIQAIHKIADGYPLQYITHYQEFMKLDFFVNKHVLIPRPDTEVLVEEVIRLCENKEKINILDLCTGSGAIGISIAKYVPQANVTLTDISKKALEIAERNSIRNHVEVQIIESNLFENLNHLQFDIIVSNPPYIETDVIPTLQKQVQIEPMIALDGGADGLDFYKKIIGEAYQYIKPKGYLCLEIGYNQKEKVERIIKETLQYDDISYQRDLAGHNRVIIAKKR